MKNEDRIVELLAESLIKQDLFIEGLNNLGDKVDKLGDKVDKMSVEISEMKEEISLINRNANRQEKLLEHILEALSDDVPHYNQVLDVEYLENGKRVVLHKHEHKNI
ncbi:MAG: hypothetical protein SFY32_09680 [Bacteroidota bacterium]|nr:hypothetical protein [Bacteroidota bacterium]